MSARRETLIRGLIRVVVQGLALAVIFLAVMKLGGHPLTVVTWK